MKQLIHNGVYIPPYEPKGYTIKYKGKKIKLTPEQEEMVVAFVKKFDTDYMKDEVFVNNFLSDLRIALNIEEEVKLEDFDFSSVYEALQKEKELKKNLPKEMKKKLREDRKKMREALKEKYGYAIVDGQRVPIMNWTVEPPGLYISKGKHPLRGRYKRRIKEEEIILNLSPDAPRPDGRWKVEWKPDKLYIARWRDPLSGKWKYVWFSMDSVIRQERAKKKWDLALKIPKYQKKLDKHIKSAILSDDEERQKLGLAVWLIQQMGIRVGDEKIAGETGNVGCTTLKKENIQFEGNKVILDFIGKDFVPWHRELELPSDIHKVFFKLWKKTPKGQRVFDSLNSKKIAKFLQEVIPNATAKIFRTHLAGKTWEMSEEKYTSLYEVKEDSPLYLKKTAFKLINCDVAKRLNHKKKLPKNFQERLKKKEERIQKYEEKLKELEEKLKKAKTEKQKARLLERIRKIKEKIVEYRLDYEVTKETAEWNLNTSLNSYIDPRRILKYCLKYNYPVEKAYSKSLRKKFEWAMKELGVFDGEVQRKQDDTTRTKT